MTKAPGLLKVRDVADLPSQRIDYAKARTDHLIVVEICDQSERPSAGFLKRNENIGRGAASLSDDSLLMYRRLPAGFTASRRSHSVRVCELPATGD